MDNDSRRITWIQTKYLTLSKIRILYEHHRLILDQLKRTIPKKLIKEILVGVAGLILIWAGLWAAFGTLNPFYVVASGSMVPELEVNDLLVVQAHTPFEDIEIGQIIVFDRPKDHDRVIVHRVVSIIDEDPRTLKTKGDSNPSSIPGTDFPITQTEYIGSVEYTIPKVGYITHILKPPTNYIIILIALSVMGSWEFFKRRK